MKTLIPYTILILITAFLGWQLYNKSESLQSKEQVIQEKNGQVKTWKDKAGLYHAEKIAANVSLKDLKNELDSVKEVNENTQSYTGIATRTEDSIEIKIQHDTVIDRRIDTVKQYIGTFNYKDKWSRFQGEVWENSISINYSVSDSIELTTEWRSQGWFKPDQLYVEGVSHNPNTRINWIRNYTVREAPQDKIVVVVGPGASITKNGLQGSVNITVGWKVWGF